ncbi:periplasmic nitrate reductase, NapE protein [Oceanisphaera ostreae]|uniref:Periplasmic nitrate reductase, NapE protein n=1 Tax=Oceanisphaera ostreae TaxID=914151 RepID=A0ABW3KGA1_9GAMM
MMNKSDLSPSRRREWQTFLLLTVVLIPLLSVITVAGYGFIVWFIQMIFGPPGHL